MPTFRRLLVNLNPLADEHPALDQALSLAARMSATVTIVDVLPDVPDSARKFVTPAIEQELVDHRWAGLQTIVDRHGGGITPLVLRGTPAITLIREIQRSGYDLLLRSHGQGHSEPRPYGPIDMQLLRKCPCPVWLVGQPAPVPPRRILAAINASCNNEGEAALNRAIIDHALTLRASGTHPVTVLYVWSAFGYDLLQRRMSAPEFAAFVEAARATAAADLERFTEELGPDRIKVQPVLLEGQPHDVLPAYVRTHQIDLVVMGTVARAGLAGFIMGNTAERIITGLRGSLVAIKPPGFVSPVRADAPVD